MEKLPLLASRISIYDYPKHIPGYTGHCPSQKFNIGETYGNATASFYNHYRNSCLANSKQRYGRGGDKHVPFPVYYENDPSLVIGTKKTDHHRWKAAQKYTLSNVSSSAQRMRNSKMAAEDHREKYKDHSGTLKKVAEISLPRIPQQFNPICIIQPEAEGQLMES